MGSDAPPMALGWHDSRLVDFVGCWELLLSFWSDKVGGFVVVVVVVVVVDLRDQSF